MPQGQPHGASATETEPADAWQVLQRVAAGGDRVVLQASNGKPVVLMAETELTELLDAAGAHPRLTERERAVLRLVELDRAVALVASTLGLAENTVAQHLVSARRKLGVSTSRAAAAIARERGLLT